MAAKSSLHRVPQQAARSAASPSRVASLRARASAAPRARRKLALSAASLARPLPCEKNPFTGSQPARERGARRRQLCDERERTRALITAADKARATEGSERRVGRRAKRGRTDFFNLPDEAVSSVIGALLVLVALTMLLALMQATTVPGMNKEAEVAHSDKVLEEFFALQEKVDEAGASGVARTAKITPGTLYPQVPFLYNPVAGTSGTASLLRDRTVAVRYYAGTPFNSTRTFTSASFPFNENNLASVSLFNMTFTGMSAAGPPEVTVTATGGYASVFNFDRGSGGCCSNDLIIDWGANGGGCPDPQTIPGYFAAPTPVNILACETGLTAFAGVTNLAFTYTPGGPGAGWYTLLGTRDPQNWSPVNATAASLNLSANYNYWSPPGPVLRYEHGAVVKVFNGVGLNTSPSAMLGATHNSTSNITAVSVAVPRLNASNASVSQREPLSIRLNPGPLSRTQTMANNLTVEVGTPFPALWSAHFNATMTNSGLPAPGNWTVSSGTGWARLDIERGSPPRLNLTVSTATVEAAL